MTLLMAPAVPVGYLFGSIVDLSKNRNWTAYGMNSAFRIPVELSRLRGVYPERHPPALVALAERRRARNDILRTSQAWCGSPQRLRVRGPIYFVPSVEPFQSTF